MPFTIIPFPISIIFIIIFSVAILAVLWKLQGKGKFYRIMFYLTLVSAMLFLLAITITWVMSGGG